MADVATQPGHYVLFVTGPLRKRLYRRFVALFDGRDVEVRVDRRITDRRRERRGPDGDERRRRERRRRPPDWIVPPHGGF